MFIIFAFLTLSASSFAHGAEQRNSYSGWCYNFPVQNGDGTFHKKFDFAVQSSSSSIVYKPHVRMDPNDLILDLSVCLKREALDNGRYEGTWRIVEFKKRPHIFALLEYTQKVGDALVPHNAILSLPADNNDLFLISKLSGCPTVSDRYALLCKIVVSCLDGTLKDRVCLIKSRMAAEFYDNVIEQLPVSFDTLPDALKNKE